MYVQRAISKGKNGAGWGTTEQWGQNDKHRVSKINIC